jgi:Multicopper oxidase
MPGMPASGGPRAGSAAQPGGGGTVRDYFVSADEVLWDYAPTGRNEITGAPFDETAAPYVLPGAGRIGARYLKCLYRGYTDAGFGSLQERSPQEAHLGFLGPVLTAEVGDTIRVVFRNTCPFPASVHPHGVFYAKADEGAPYADGSPRDVDREVFLDFTVDDENQSPLLAANQARAGVPVTPPAEEGEEIAESNLKHSINGYLYGGMPVIDVRVGQHVRWYAMSMGTEVDLHTPHWHGNDVLVAGMRMDVVSLLPAQMVTADMVPDDPGTWLVHCHVADHIRAGMSARYRVDG